MESDGSSSFRCLLLSARYGRLLLSVEQLVPVFATWIMKESHKEKREKAASQVEKRYERI